MSCTLIVTVDTEEEGLWGGQYRRSGNTVENTRGIPRFQSLCDRFDIRPTYLVDTPVVENERSVRMLKAIQNAGRGEIGAHLHPWCAPPFDETASPRNTFMCNLPESLQREKLQRLTDDITQAFERRPTSFRAGRYGVDIVGISILRDLGYLVDSSVINFSRFSKDDGPDYSNSPLGPYLVGRDNILSADTDGELLEVPVSVGFNWRSFHDADRLQRWAERPSLRPFHLVGIMDRLRIVQKIKFSPEQADFRMMKRLINGYRYNRLPCIVMMFHSSSLIAGFSPYVPDDSRLEQFFNDLETTFDYCVNKCGMSSDTLTQFSERFIPLSVAQN